MVVFWYKVFEQMYIHYGGSIQRSQRQANGTLEDIEKVSVSRPLEYNFISSIKPWCFNFIELSYQKYINNMMRMCAVKSHWEIDKK